MSSSPEQEERSEEGRKLVSIPQMPDLLEAAGLKRLGAPRIRQLANEDGWPEPVYVSPSGKMRLFDWADVEAFFRTRIVRQGERTDLKGKPAAE